LALAIIAMRCYGMYIARSHLRKIRLIKGYTIRELASRSGITREWIERIEKQGNPNLRIATICKLAEALDVRPEELITYERITNK
jgi:transcriptional regulator with XRE-family HTH domain